MCASAIMARPYTQHIDELLHELFSDDSENISIQQNLPGSQNDLPSIPGLTFIPNFLTKQQEETLMQQVEASGWFSTSMHSSKMPRGCSNQAMVFGVNNMPQWLQQLGQQLPLQSSWPAELSTRLPIFDTAIINQYLPGDGITAHVDLLRFSDGIAIISLGDPAIMSFTREQPFHAQQQQQQQHLHAVAVEQSNSQGLQQGEQQKVAECGQRSDDAHQQQQQQQLCQLKQVHSCCCEQPGKFVKTPRVKQPGQYVTTPPVKQQQLLQDDHQLLLQGGNLLLLHGEARYRWRHGIAAVEAEVLFCSSCKAKAAAGEASTLDLLSKATGGPTAAGGTLPTYAAPDGASATLGVDATGNTGVVAAAGGIAAAKAGVGFCRQCVQVVRGKRMSITLRRLDPNQTVLILQ